jgi:hypothetical protein
MTSKTRLGMAFAVNVESHTLENPDKIAVQNVKRTLRYVKGTQDTGIKYTSSDSETVKLEAFSDADYAGDVKKSVTGYVIIMSGGPISWCSRKQSMSHYQPLRPNILQQLSADNMWTGLIEPTPESSSRFL